MAKRMIWTRKFSESLNVLLSCLNTIYSLGTLRRLGDGIVRSERLLSDNPKMGSIEESLSGLRYEYRHVVVKPYFKIIYRCDEECAYFIEIWDTRRDPSLLKYRLVQK